MGNEFDEALALQVQQRLADGNKAAPELVGQHFLAQRIAALDLARNNQLAYLVGNRSRDGLVFDA